MAEIQISWNEMGHSISYETKEKIMFVKRSLVLLLLLVSMTACGPKTPTATQTTSNTPTVGAGDANGPTETSIPTSTIAPTSDVTSTSAPAATAITTGVLGTVVPPAKTTAAGTAVATTAAGSGSNTGSTADKYAFVSQNLPDNYQVRPGRTVTISWTVKNVGTVGWSTDYTVRHFGGVAAAKESYNLTKIVPANGTILITISFVTPAAPGAYSTWWKLTNAQGGNFGDVDFSFVVSNNPVQATKAPVVAATATPAK